MTTIPEAPPGEERSPGSILRVLRDHAHLTQPKLAELHPGVSGLVPTMISHWESDRRIPLPFQLQALLDSLDPTDADIWDILVGLAHRGDVRYRSFVAGARLLPLADRVVAWKGFVEEYPGQTRRAEEPPPEDALHVDEESPVVLVADAAPTVDGPGLTAPLITSIKRKVKAEPPVETPAEAPASDEPATP